MIDKGHPVDQIPLEQVAKEAVLINLPNKGSNSSVSFGPWPRLNNAAPSVQPHYRAFIPTTGHSAPVLRIGTLVLAVLAA